MRKIGLIVAVEEEAMRQKYGEGYDLNDGYCTVLYQTAKSQVYALYSGAGEIFAAAATQYLIDRYCGGKTQRRARRLKITSPARSSSRKQLCSPESSSA